MLHTMCIGQHSAAADHEATAIAGELALALPWQGEVGLRVDAEDLEGDRHVCLCLCVVCMPAYAC